MQETRDIARLIRISLHSALLSATQDSLFNLLPPPPGLHPWFCVLFVGGNASLLSARMSRWCLRWVRQGAAASRTIMPNSSITIMYCQHGCQPNLAQPTKNVGSGVARSGKTISEQEPIKLSGRALYDDGQMINSNVINHATKGRLG